MHPLVGRTTGKHTYRAGSLCLRHPIDHLIERTIPSEGDDPTVAILGSLLRRHHAVSSILRHQLRDIPPLL